MVIRALSGLLLAMAATSSTAESCTSGSEFEPPLCPLHLPRITKVTIVKNAAGSPSEGDGVATCDGFRISEMQVRRYLAKAKTTTSRDAHATLDWSPCHATGSVEFSNGRTGQWDINLSRAGSISIDGAENIVLYCPKCRFKPFGE